MTCTPRILGFPALERFPLKQQHKNENYNIKEREGYTIERIDTGGFWAMMLHSLIIQQALPLPTPAHKHTLDKTAAT